MKPLFLALCLCLLTACAAPQQQALTLTPTPVLSGSSVVNNVSYTIASQDARTAQYVALIDNGHSKITPLPAGNDFSAKIEQALVKQFAHQGFTLAKQSNNSIKVLLQDALVNIKHSVMQKEMHAKVTLTVVAETPRGKLEKTYYGTANRTGMMSASNSDIETVLNDTVNLVLKKIATDPELTHYMKERF